MQRKQQVHLDPLHADELPRVTEPRSDINQPLLEKLLEFVVEEAANAGKGHQKAIDHLVDVDYDGDLEAARKGYKKNKTWRALLKHDKLVELGVTAATLRNHMRCKLLELDVGKTLADQLPLKHKLALLPLADPKELIALASLAVELNLSWRALKVKVNELLRTAKTTLKPQELLTRTDAYEKYAVAHSTGLTKHALTTLREALDVVRAELRGGHVQPEPTPTGRTMKKTPKFPSAVTPDSLPSEEEHRTDDAPAATAEPDGDELAKRFAPSTDPENEGQPGTEPTAERTAIAQRQADERARLTGRRMRKQVADNLNAIPDEDDGF